MSDPNALGGSAKALNLQGLPEHWSEVASSKWIAKLLDSEDQELRWRSLERRLKDAPIGQFQPLCDCDWAWPKRCDHAAIEALMALDFQQDAANVVLVSPTASARR